MAVIDDFNRADSSSSLGTTPVGGLTWIAEAGTWGIQSNKAYESAGATQVNAVTVASGVADATVSVTLTVPAAANFYGLILRGNGAGNDYAVLIDVGANTINMQRRVGGSATLIGGTTTSYSATTGDVLSVVMVGSSMTVKVNGSTKFVASDSTYNSQTRHGFWTYYPGTTRFDNFSIIGAGETYGPGAVTAPVATAAGAGDLPLPGSANVSAPHATASGAGTVSGPAPLLSSQPGVVAFIGDSTGDATDEWAYLVSADLRAYYPNSKVDFRQYNSGSSTYGSATELFNGGGAATTVYNGHVAGITADYPLAVGGRLAAMVPSGVNVVVLNFGHNHAAESPATFLAKMDTLVAAIQSLRPGAQIIVTSQNQQKSPATYATEHNLREDAMSSWAGAAGLGYIPTYEAFIGSASPSSLVESDGIHPTAGVGGGSVLWAFTAETSLFGERRHALRAPAATASGSATVSPPPDGYGVAVAPAATASGSGTSTATATGAASAPPATAAGTGASGTTVSGSGSASAPAATGSGAGYSGEATYELSAPSPRGAAVVSFEVYVPAPTDVLLLCAPSVHGGTARIQPVPLPIPDGITDRPIRRQVHLMEPKTPDNPRKMGDPLRSRADGELDGYLYPIEESDVGRLRVFASGVDITYLTGAPTTVSEWSFAKPFGPQAASFTVPLPEWSYPGRYEGPHGNIPILWHDAPIEIALEDADGNLHHLWEGYTGEETDTAAPGQTGVTWNCEGTFNQAAHWLNDPPAVMDPRDVGHVIADALNGVPNRRWNKIKRFTTGVLTESKGDSSQSVLAYVADLIGGCFNDDGQQLRLVRTGPYSYVIDWTQPTTDGWFVEGTGPTVVPDWTFTKGSPGFDMTITRPQNARRDMVFGRGIAPDGGFWMNRYFPGLMASTPPVYAMSGFANMDVGTTDADTVGGQGVSTWQRKMRELGYPVKVDGVMNSNDTKWVREIQERRGITVDGSLGPQTWAATWEGGPTTPETDTVRLPLNSKDIAQEFFRDASGAIVGRNPVFDRNKILYATPEVDFGTNMKKSAAKPLSAQIRYREASPGYVGTLTANGVDPKEVDASRLFIADGHNILVDGHHWGTVVQVSDVTHTPTSTRMTVDSGARGQAVVDAVLTRARDTRRSLSGKSTKITDRGTLNASQLGQYESESPAGKYSRTAVNGDSGLWTVRCIYVAEQGLARFRLTTSPNAELVTLICGRKITANQVAAIVPDPLADSSGWYDAVDELTEKYGLVQVAGTPDNPGGYYPRQKPGDGVENPGPLTGVQAAGNISMKSQRGGFFWVAVYTSRSTFVEGEFEPEVPIS